MNTHVFAKEGTVQHLCLTLEGDNRLLYESLRLIALDWNVLQIQFRQQMHTHE